jgi:hypothetical protein
MRAQAGAHSAESVAAGRSANRASNAKAVTAAGSSPNGVSNRTAAAAARTPHAATLA